MSTSLLKRAAETIKRTKERTIKVARENQHTTALVAGGLAGSGVAVAAAFADQKMGEGKQWKVADTVPVVAIAGAAMLVPAFFTRKMPIVQAASVAAGMTALNIAGYRYLVEEGISAGSSS